MKKRKDIEALANAPTLPGYDLVFDRYNASVQEAITANVSAESIEYDSRNQRWYVYVRQFTVTATCTASFPYDPASEAGPVAAMTKLIADVREWRARVSTLDPKPSTVRILAAAVAGLTYPLVPDEPGPGSETAKDLVKAKTWLDWARKDCE